MARQAALQYTHQERDMATDSPQESSVGSSNTSMIASGRAAWSLSLGSMNFEQDDLSQGRHSPLAYSDCAQ
jgi:hypothetical protein